MNNNEKHACFNIGVTILVLGTFAVLLLSHGWDYATRAFGLLALWGVGPILYLRTTAKEVGSSVAIRRLASSRGLLAAGVAGAALFSFMLLVGLLQVQPVTGIIISALGAWIAFILTHGAFTLHLHARLRPRA